jgi:hypothetical protein
MNTWTTLPDETIIAQTVAALANNGIQATVVENGAEAKKLVLEMIPQGSEVMTMTSVTADSIGLDEELNKTGGSYNPVRDKMYAMNKATHAKEMNQLGAAPEYAVGSVHAVTTDGVVLIASNTGSQLPAYAYAAQHVIWVVGAQKIVKDVDAGMKRIYEHVLPLESERARKAYGIPADRPGSNVSKLLIINKEVNPTRLHMVIVKESLGF